MGHRFWAAAVAAFVSVQAPAAPPDLHACRYSNGISIEADVCQVLRRRAAEDSARQEAQAAALERLTRENEAEQAARQQRQADNLAAAQAAREAEAARQRAALQQVRARMDAEDKADARREAQQAATRTAAKASCGTDYLAPRIGMSIERARQCVSPSLQVTGQINRQDGVVTTYRTSGGATFHTMNGVIVAWTR